MTALQVHDALNPFQIISVNLADLLSLPDPLAAEALNQRIGVLDHVQRVYERSFAERAIIVREFEARRLWAFLIDPDTGQVFPHMTAWLSCSSFLGCRRTNFEALRAGKLLADVPSASLVDISKGNLHTLAQLSTAVRNDPGILEAAKNLSPSEFEEKVEKEQPHQHIEARRMLRFSPGRSGVKLVEKWIAYALDHDIADGRDDAIVKACERALYDAELGEEISKMPAVEVVPA